MNKKQTMTLLMLLVFFTVVSPIISHAKEKSVDAIEFKINVLKGLDQYTDLLRTPSYLAIALDINRISIANSLNLRVASNRSLQTKYGNFVFTGQKGDVFKYDWSIKYEGFNIISNIPCEIDISQLPQGTLLMRLYYPLKDRIPQVLIDKIDTKVQTLAEHNNQAKLLDYFNQLHGKLPEVKDSTSIGELVMIDFYNSMSRQYVVNNESKQSSSEGSIPRYVFMFLTFVVFISICFGLFAYIRHRSPNSNK